MAQLLFIQNASWGRKSANSKYGKTESWGRGGGSHRLHQCKEKLKLICVQCQKVFTRDDEVTIHCANGAMYFFCSKTCKYDFIYPDILKAEPEKLEHPST